MTSTGNMTDRIAAQQRSVKALSPESRTARTELGRKLREIRQRIVDSGQPLLDENAIDREVQSRRGEKLTEE